MADNTSSNQINQFLRFLEQCLFNTALTIDEKEQFKKLYDFLKEAGRNLAEGPAELKAQIEELRQKLAEVNHPPYEYGIFLSRSPSSSDDESEENSHDLVIGTRGQRFEVKLAVPNVKVEDLREGQELVLNKVMNVVGVRNEQVRGETAEVVNVISPSGTAKILAILEEMLRVQLPDGEKIEVAGDAELYRSLRAGDVVELDQTKQQAIQKVRPRLHVRSGGNDGIIVEMSDRLFQEGVGIGDLVRVDTRLQFAFEKLPSYQTGGLTLEEVPDVTYEDIGGLDEQTEAIQDAIELPYLHQHLFEEYQLTRPKGILLYGPPGCGKTMIAKAVANSLTQRIREHLKTLRQKTFLYQNLLKDPQNSGALRAYQQLSFMHTGELPTIQPALSGEEVCRRLAADLQANNIDLEALEAARARLQKILDREDGVRSFFLNVKGPELLDKYVGETENKIRKVFEEARRRATFYTPVVIFFDEMEAMFRTRGSGRSSDIETTIVPQFLAEMDGVEASENIILIGASNRQDMIDPAILRPGRLDIKIKIEPPNAEAAMTILALHLTPDLPLKIPEASYQSKPSRLVFKPAAVQRTLVRFQDQLPSELWEQMTAAIPNRADIRKAMATSAPLQELCQNAQVANCMTAIAQQEQIAEALIFETVEFLFSRSSYLEAVTSESKRYSFPLSEFVSGAVLVSLVSRAKKTALKRQIAASAPLGIQLVDLKKAVQEEFIENAEQLVAHRLEQDIRKVNIHFEEEEDDPWSVEKVRIYRAS